MGPNTWDWDLKQKNATKTQECVLKNKNGTKHIEHISMGQDRMQWDPMHKNGTKHTEIKPVWNRTKYNGNETKHIAEI